MSKIKFEFVLSDEGAFNILSVIRDEVTRLKFEKKLDFLEGKYTQAEMDYFTMLGNSLEADLETMAKGSSKVK